MTTPPPPWAGRTAGALPLDRPAPIGPVSEYAAARREGAAAASAGAPGTALPEAYRRRPFARVGWLDGWAGRRLDEGRPMLFDDTVE